MGRSENDIFAITEAANNTKSKGDRVQKTISKDISNIQKDTQEKEGICILHLNEEAHTVTKKINKIINDADNVYTRVSDIFSFVKKINAKMDCTKIVIQKSVDGIFDQFNINFSNRVKKTTHGFYRHTPTREVIQLMGKEKAQLQHEKISFDSEKKVEHLIQATIKDTTKNEKAYITALNTKLEALCDKFKTIAQRSRIPITVTNVPSFTQIKTRVDQYSNGKISHISI